MKQVLCEHNNCDNEAKIMYNNKPYCIKHYKEKKNEKEKL